MRPVEALLIQISGKAISAGLAFNHIDDKSRTAQPADAGTVDRNLAPTNAARRFACINDMPIKESERKFHWPLGRRPDDHPSLSDLGL